MEYNVDSPTARPSQSRAAEEGQESGIAAHRVVHRLRPEKRQSPRALSDQKVHQPEPVVEPTQGEEDGPFVPGGDPLPGAPLVQLRDDRLRLLTPPQQGQGSAELLQEHGIPAKLLGRPLHGGERLLEPL